MFKRLKEMKLHLTEQEFKEYLGQIINEEIDSASKEKHCRRNSNKNECLDEGQLHDKVRDVLTEMLVTEEKKNKKSKNILEDLC